MWYLANSDEVTLEKPLVRELRDVLGTQHQFVRVGTAHTRTHKQDTVADAVRCTAAVFSVLHIAKTCIILCEEPSRGPSPTGRRMSLYRYRDLLPPAIPTSNPTSNINIKWLPTTARLYHLSPDGTLTL